jgi:ATP-dependent RNA helicase SUPV3L1/SUV3
MTASARTRVTAVLGPTNTGKTYLAIERMLGHASGMIGFPLRLLARENYDRVVKVKGAAQVALVTGEEKILPPGARYFLCTVESMPVDRPVAFLAIDEIQLCADPERGHVFTDRLLHARGTGETMFMGADTMRPILRKLVPEVEVVSRPRFSTLSYAGERKLTRLPPRSSVVAFSASEVYETAELIRRQRGGTAVVLGALSPRTRNAQVAMFEAGEVDYLVATDAIGMGLNLNLEHVAFARLAKFDGQALRRLRAPELAQIAGRAGRHMSDGTFGTTNEIGPIDPAVVEAVEEHRFDAHEFIYWRTRDLDFRSPRSLLKSLERRPPTHLLSRARECEDMQALNLLSRDRQILDLAAHREAVRLLWDVCQIPDFQKILSDQHARLLGQVYRHLMAPGTGGSGRLPPDWVAGHIARIDRVEGDIDTLVARIAHIRTWTYIAHRANWLDDSAHWQERTRAIEDRLSDALHERLTARFVDRRAAILVKRLRAGDEMLAAVKADGTVLVEGEYVGRLEGFRFHVDDAVTGADQRPLLTAARRALLSEIPTRVRALEQTGNDGFVLRPDGTVMWRDAPVARLVPGDSPLAPGVEPLGSEFLDGRGRERVRQRLVTWLHRHLRVELAPLYRVADAAAGGDISGAARGLLYSLSEALGPLPRAPLEPQLQAIGKAERKRLTGLGLRLGRACAYLPAWHRGGRNALNALLWSTHARHAPSEAGTGAAAAVELRSDTEAGWYRTQGYCVLPGRKGPGLAIRAEAFEQIAFESYRRGKSGAFLAAPQLLALAGGNPRLLEAVLRALGYGVRDVAGGLEVLTGHRKNSPAPGRRKASKALPARKAAGRPSTASPFDILRDLTPGE